jgi:hypothetical protein
LISEETLTAFVVAKLVRSSRLASRCGWAWLDEASGLPQEPADAADALGDGFGPDAEWAAMATSVTTDGGGEGWPEPVGQGEHGTAADASGSAPRAVTAAGIEACFPLVLPRGAELKAACLKISERGRISANLMRQDEAAHQLKREPSW